MSYAWSAKGEQPKVQQKQSKRERLTLFGSVNPISGECIVQQAERGNAITFKKYLKKVLNTYKNSKGKIYMIRPLQNYLHINSLMVNN